MDPEAVYTVIRSIPNYSRAFSVPRPYSVDYIGDQLEVSTWQGLSGSTYINQLNHTLTHINRELILISVLGEMATIYTYQMMCLALGVISRLQTLHSLGSYHLDLRTNNLLIAKDERSPIKVNGNPLSLVTHPKVSVLLPWPSFDVVLSDFDRSVTEEQINRGDIHLQGVTFSKKLAGLIDFRHLTKTLRLLVNSISLFLNYVSNQDNSDRRSLLVAMRKMDRRLHDHEERLGQCINDESRRIQNKEGSSICFSNNDYLNFLNNLRVEMTSLYRGDSIAC